MDVGRIAGQRSDVAFQAFSRLAPALESGGRRPPALSSKVYVRTETDLKLLRAEFGRVNDLLADARAHEVAATLAKLREDVALLGITDEEVRRALGYDRPARPPARYYEPVTGNTWSGMGRRPSWLAGKRLEDYAIGALQPQACWPGEE